MLVETRQGLIDHRRLKRMIRRTLSALENAELLGFVAGGYKRKPHNPFPPGSRRANAWHKGMVAGYRDRVNLRIV